MNKQFILSVIVLFFVVFFFGFVIHGLLLADDYLAMPSLMRPEEEQMGLFHFMALAHLLIAIGLTWVYRMGRETDKDWIAQGVRFGIAVSVLAVIPTYMIYYVVQQTPEALAIKQISLETVGMVITGMVTAFMNR